MCMPGSKNVKMTGQRFLSLGLFVFALEALAIEARSGSQPHLQHPLLRSLKNYELFQPFQSSEFYKHRSKRDLSTGTESLTGLHAGYTSFTVEYEGTKYILDVSLNNELLPQSFQVSSYLDTGELHVHKPTIFEQDHCYYQGYVRGIAKSKVILSTCNGLKGSIILQNEVLIFEPLSIMEELTVDKTHHVIYRSSDFVSNKPNGTCGNQETEYKLPPFFSNSQKSTESFNSGNQRNKRSLPEEKKYVELFVVVDHSLSTRLGSVKEVQDHVKEIANYADAFYRMLDMRVVLSSVEIWSQEDKISISTDPKEMLDDFVHYRIDKMSEEPSSSPWVYADNVQLLLGKDFDGSTVGLASVATMCSAHSIAVCQDTSLSLFSTATTVAHEMGHNFGLVHDGAGCDCSEGAECIMAAGSGFSDVREWTDCSRGYMEQGERLGLMNCLVNVPPPSRIFGGAKCGNQIVEEDEQCDCGTIESCESKCCDPSTCKLKPGALCDEGRCCEGCQFISEGTMCRTPGDEECDLAEYCSGRSGNCPSNVFVEDGSPCFGGFAVCNEGVCLTHDLQCKNMWGQEATSSDKICYVLINSLGNQNGNCGQVGTKFMSCSEENVSCGKLLCAGGSEFPLVGGSRIAFSSTIKFGPTPLECKTLPSESNAIDEVDPGLVKDGTLCSPGKICEQGVCKEVEAHNCSLACNGNGVCNNLGHCHCKDGFAPPECVKPGEGGSVDSGLWTSSSVTENTQELAVSIKAKGHKNCKAKTTKYLLSLTFCTSRKMHIKN